MMTKNYQRRHLRAPFKDVVLYSSGDHVLQASTINISEGGLLINELPVFPPDDEVDLMFCLPTLPLLKNFSVLKMQTFSRDLFQRHVIRVKAHLVRREELSQDLDNLFRSRFGLEFTKVEPKAHSLISEYVTTFSSNIIFLQTLIDSFNTDEETKMRTWALAQILGYSQLEKIAQLRAQVGHDYKSLQWL